MQIGAIVTLSVLPFVLNDFLFIPLQNHYYAVATIDYLTRLFALSIVAWSIVNSKITFSNLGINRLPLWGSEDRRVFIGWSIVLVLVCVGISRINETFLPNLWKNTVLFDFPLYPSSGARLFDLTIGIALVAISEELIFRGLLMSWLNEKGLVVSKVILIQAAVFALIHWSCGAKNILYCFLWAIPCGMFFSKYKNIYPCIVAHYFTDLFAFS